MDALKPEDPSRIGPFIPLARIGVGGMGRVYLARSRGGRPVAVKVIRAEYAEDERFRIRFRREVQAARTVDGMYTAPVLDAGPDDAEPWLATAYIPGPSLQRAVHDHGPLPERSARVLGAGIAEALGAIHGAGLIHRDLKPSNVILGPDGPRVIDFGISASEGGSSLTTTGIVVGSPRYSSPEQCRADPNLTPASDVFALGGVLVFAATGVPPFGDGPDHVQLYLVVHEKPDLTGVPMALRPIVSACLEKDPANRPSTEELLDVLLPPDDIWAAGAVDWLPAGVQQDLREYTADPEGGIAQAGVALAASGGGASDAGTWRPGNTWATQNFAASPEVAMEATPEPLYTTDFSSFSSIAALKSRRSLFPTLAVLAVLGVGAAVAGTAFALSGSIPHQAPGAGAGVGSMSSSTTGDRSATESSSSSVPSSASSSAAAFLTAPTTTASSSPSSPAESGPPIAVTIQPYQWEDKCGQWYLLNRKPSDVPPPPVEQDARGWASALGAVPAGTMKIQLSVQGTSSNTVVLQGLHIRTVSKAAPLPWSAFSMASGCGGGLVPVSFDVNLDAERPLAHPTPGQQGDTVIPAVDFPFKVSESDPQVLTIYAHAHMADVAWYLELGWSSGSHSGTVRIDDHGKPFQTSGAKGRPIYDYDTGSNSWLIDNTAVVQ